MHMCAARSTAEKEHMSAMLVANHRAMQAGTEDAADVFGADVSKLEHSGNIDRF